MLSSDSDLVLGCQNGDEEAFRLLVQRHEGPVYSLVRRMVRSEEDARDLTQEVFVRAFGALHQFDRARTFSFWINRIAANLTIDFLRKRRPVTVQIHEEFVDEAEGGVGVSLVDQEPLQDRRMEIARDREALENLIQELPEHYRIVIILRHLQQRSLDEISALLDLPLGTVKARLSRAHRILRETLSHNPKYAEISQDRVANDIA